MTVKAVASSDTDVCSEYVSVVCSKSVGQIIVNYGVGFVLLVIFCVPLGIIIAVAIKLDSRGPVFFRQPRIGLNNQVFHIWKFRTMHAHLCDTRGSQLTQHNDPRITRIGSSLRRWSIDEIPQIINVLTGEMALVGPRPHPLDAKAGNMLYAEVVPNYHLRQRVLPGITGWAQVNGWRGETVAAYQIEQRVKHDLEYIAKQSIWFDLRILLLTAKVIFVNSASAF